MYKNIGSIFISDGAITNSDAFFFEINNKKIIYEIMRVINKKVVFLNDHLNRLLKSFEILNIDIILIENIKRDILLLVETHESINKNIKLDVCFKGNIINYRVYFVESFYPPSESYENGISTITSNIERNSPHIKLLSMDFKEHIKSIKGDNFEVLLINKSGYVVEGSRSNLIFVKGNTIYSPSLSEILEGITLKNVLEFIKKSKYKIEYSSVLYKKIDQYDACFLTGTSIGILPISSINEIKFKSSMNPLVLNAMKSYNENIGKY